MIKGCIKVLGSSTHYTLKKMRYHTILVVLGATFSALKKALADLVLAVFLPDNTFPKESIPIRGHSCFFSKSKVFSLISAHWDSNQPKYRFLFKSNKESKIINILQLYNILQEGTTSRTEVFLFLQYFNSSCRHS